MTTPSSGAGSGHCATHSNPNITRLPHSCSGNGMIARSTSHPPEMFCWNEPVTQHHLISYVDREIQTDTDIMNNFIIENPRSVLEILGLDPDVIFTMFKKTDWLKTTTTCNENESSDLNEKTNNEWLSSCPFYWDTSDKINGRRSSAKFYDTTSIVSSHEDV